MATVKIVATFTDEGSPATGLGAAVRVNVYQLTGTHDSETSSLVVSDEQMVEVALGIYQFIWEDGEEDGDYDPSADYAVRCDGGGTLSASDRYKFSTNDQAGDELLVDWENGGRLDLIIDDVQTDIGNLNDISVDDIWNALKANHTVHLSMADYVGDIFTYVNSIDGMLPSNTRLAGSSYNEGYIQLDDATGALPAGAFANHPDVGLSSSAIDSVLDEVIESQGSVTMRQALSVMLSKLLGEASGGGTTEVTFLTPDGNATRAVMTVDQNGNRSTVTLTP